MEKVKSHENPGKGLQGGMRRYGGGRKSMKEEKIETIKGNIIKIHKLKRKKKEKKIKGPKAKLKRLRNQKFKLPEEKELLGMCDGLATAAGTTKILDTICS